MNIEKPIELWIATGNQGKLIEIKTILNKYNLDIHHQKELSYYYSPEENGKTFLDNARIKARSLKAVKTGVWVVGEDTGLEVFGLNNLPGVHSARYAGPHASDAENRAKLLKMVSLRSAQKREARFYTAMVAYSPDGTEFIYEGELKGRLTIAEKGQNGFGYDPIFIPEGYEKTLAELEVSIKNKISHRAKALMALVAGHPEIFAERD